MSQYLTLQPDDWFILASTWGQVLSAAPCLDAQTEGIKYNPMLVCFSADGQSNIQMAEYFIQMFKCFFNKISMKFNLT